MTKYFCDSCKNELTGPLAAKAFRAGHEDSATSDGTTYGLVTPVSVIVKADLCNRCYVTIIATLKKLVAGETQ